MRTYDLTKGILAPICKKIFAASASPYFKVDTKKKQEKVLEDFKKEMENTAHITCGNVQISTNYYSKKEYARLYFNIGSACKRIDSLRCELQFDEYDGLTIEIGDNKTYFFKNINQIIELREEIQKAAIVADKKYEILQAENLKKAKIKDFKKAAIIAKILELVKLENVPFTIDDSFATKIVVFIRLSDAVRLEVNIPYKDYQIVLQNTQAAIQTIREFVDKGIAINVRTSITTTPYYEWQMPNK